MGSGCAFAGELPVDAWPVRWFGPTPKHPSNAVPVAALLHHVAGADKSLEPLSLPMSLGRGSERRPRASCRPLTQRRRLHPNPWCRRAQPAFTKRHSWSLVRAPSLGRRDSDANVGTDADPRVLRRRLALLIRLHDAGPLGCTYRGGGMRATAFITQPGTIGKKSAHLPQGALAASCQRVGRAYPHLRGL